MLSLKCKACNSSLSNQEFNENTNDWEDLCAVCLKESGITLTPHDDELFLQNNLPTEIGNEEK